MRAICADMFGVLAVNKPCGLTSRDVVNRIQRLIRPVKVGHTGTLDPSATGVLLLAIGQATRLVEFSHGQPKEYCAEFQLDAESDTLDADSEVRLIPSPTMPSREELEAEMLNWIGAINQTPPKYSAVHVDGKRAYQLARQGETFEIQSRVVNIHSIDLIDYRYPRLELRIRCGSGTYIRSLGNDIAMGVRSAAVMTHLERTAIGPFTVKQCHDLEELSNQVDIAAALQPAAELVSHLPRVTLGSEQAQRIRNGIPLKFTDSEFERAAGVAAGREPIVAMGLGSELVAIVQLKEQGTYRSLRVFQMASETNQP
ncbi:MAG: tRNA pseudouridine(55) synthase TruB [Planctomycetales bacterium]|nr:tRNA pseudouridine(55) synthase TruB [Planctomycetales bacterium]